MYQKAKPPRHRVRREWWSIYPERAGHLAFWLRVARLMKHRHIRRNDRKGIRALCQEVDEDMVRGGEVNRV